MKFTGSPLLQWQQELIDPNGHTVELSSRHEAELLARVKAKLAAGWRIAASPEASATPATPAEVSFVVAPVTIPVLPEDAPPDDGKE